MAEANKPPAGAQPTQSKSPMLARLDAMERLIPKTGFNIVGVDSYETEPGEELYLVESVEGSEQQAQAALEKWQAAKPGEKFFIYRPDAPQQKPNS